MSRVRFGAFELVRLTAQLIQVSDQTHVWSDSFDRAAGDIMALQSDIAAGGIRAG